MKTFDMEVAMANGISELPFDAWSADTLTDSGQLRHCPSDR